MNRLERTNKGARLVALIREKVSSEGITVAELGDRLGMSTAYVSSLLGGRRPVTLACEKFLNGAAQYLGLPRAQIFQLADILVPADFEVKAKISSRFAATLETLKKDAVWRGYLPGEKVLAEMDDNLKMLVVLLYEQARLSRIDGGANA
jgi:transcriptional regulator with XRE-family HTH domain